MAASAELFSATLDDGMIFRRIIEGARHICHELNFTVSDEGIRASGMDDTRGVFVDLKLNCDGFEEFQLNANTSVGLDLNMLSEVLKIGFEGDSLQLQAADGEDFMTVVHRAKGEDRESVFTLRLLDQANMDEVNPPNIRANYEVEMNSGVLANIVNKFSQMAGKMEIEVSEKDVKFSFLNVDLLDGTITRVASTKPKKELQIKPKNQKSKSLTQVFPLQTWAKFMKSAPVSDIVKLYFSSAEEPCIIEYDLNDLGYLRFYAVGEQEEA